MGEGYIKAEVVDGMNWEKHFKFYFWNYLKFLIFLKDNNTLISIFFN